MPNGEKRIMEEFTMSEISAVDEPAQTPARAAIIKSKGNETMTELEFGQIGKVGDQTVIVERIHKTGDVSVDQSGSYTATETEPLFVGRLIKNNELSDERCVAKMSSFEGHNGVEKNSMGKVMMLTASVNGHQHSFDVAKLMKYGYCETDYAGSGEPDTYHHDHKVILNGDGTVDVSENEGHTHGVDMMKLREAMDMYLRIKMKQENVAMSQNGMLQVSVTPSMKAEEETVMTKETMTEKEKEDAKKEKEDMKAEMGKLRVLASLSDVEKAHYNSLDAEGQAAFAALDVEKRADAISKSKTGDEVVYKSADGVVFTKSDDPVIVNLVKSNDAMAKRLADAEELTKRNELEKRAKSEFAALPGTTDTHIALLKAVDGIADEGTRTEVMKSLKAKAEQLTTATTTYGRTAAPNENAVIKAGAEAEAELDRLTKSRAAEKGEDYYTAYDVVKAENPALYAKAVRT